jgi:hypothetical protein
MIVITFVCLVAGCADNPSPERATILTTAPAADDWPTRVWSECWKRPGGEPWCPPIERDRPRDRAEDADVR